jgi:hypothetical protein
VKNSRDLIPRRGAIAASRISVSLANAQPDEQAAFSWMRQIGQAEINASDDPQSIPSGNSPAAYTDNPAKNAAHAIHGASTLSGQ